MWRNAYSFDNSYIPKSVVHYPLSFPLPSLLSKKRGCRVFTLGKIKCGFYVSPIPRSSCFENLENIISWHTKAPLKCPSPMSRTSSSSRQSTIEPVSISLPVIASSLVYHWTLLQLHNVETKRLERYRRGLFLSSSFSATHDHSRERPPRYELVARELFIFARRWFNGCLAYA